MTWESSSEEEVNVGIFRGLRDGMIELWAPSDCDCGQPHYCPTEKGLCRAKALAYELGYDFGMLKPHEVTMLAAELLFRRSR